MFAGLISRWMTPCWWARRGPRHRLDHLDSGTDGYRPAGQAVFQGLALQPLHDQVVLAVAGLAVGDVAHDSGVGDGGQAIRLLLEALAELRSKAGRKS